MTGTLARALPECGAGQAVGPSARWRKILLNNIEFGFAFLSSCALVTRRSKNRLALAYLLSYT